MSRQDEWESEKENRNASILRKRYHNDDDSEYFPIKMRMFTQDRPATVASLMYDVVDAWLKVTSQLQIRPSRNRDKVFYLSAIRFD